MTWTSHRGDARPVRGCGYDLADLEGTVAERVQVSDTPPVRLQVTEYRMVEVACPACRKVTRAATPAGLAGPCCYGPDGAGGDGAAGLQRAYEHRARR